MTCFDEKLNNDRLNENRLKAAVNASAAPVPEEFIRNTERMIDRLPRKERYIVKTKLSAGLVLAILLCLLAVTAVAAVLLTGPELVEQEVLPMALENDTGAVNDTFTNEELKQIVALAEENGISLSASILRALEKGEGYWEEEVIMSLAKSQFGPYPGQWTLEEQWWFEEVIVTIGYKDYNRCRIPGAGETPIEGELTYEEAYAKAKAHIATQGYDASLLDDRTRYALWRSYYADQTSDGSILEPWWYFWFEPLDMDLPEFILEMDVKGNLTAFTHKPGLSEALASGTATFYELYDLYYNKYGTFADWTPEIFVSFKEAVDTIDAGKYEHYKVVQAFQATEFILPPEGALTGSQASDLAMAAVNRPDTNPGGAACILDGHRAIWKIMLYENSEAAWKVEVDCMTGEVLNVQPRSETGGTWQFYVPMSVEITIPTPNPEGNG